MKKSFLFLAAAFLLNASVAKSLPPPSLLDDSASFRIAKSVKLGYGDSSYSPSKGTGTKTSEFSTCSSDNNCPAKQKCVDGNCKDVCSPNPCPEETPDCEAKDHSYTCKCTGTSCGEGKQCVGDKCLPCEEGTTCNCEGKKVIDSSGKCVCPSGLSCSAGQYVSGDCSCKNCLKDDTNGDKCGCPGNTVPDGNGSCYCKETKTCSVNYSFDSLNTCECVLDCPTGTFPIEDGCKPYACTTDEDCPAANRCENGGTESAQCVPCGKNEQCRCDEGELSDGTGKCVPVACKTGLVCSKDITEQCCAPGKQCVNPDTVESYCAACEIDTQCTCPDGYLVNKDGKCVIPECTKNSDCPNGKYCENPGKSNAECVPCKEGEPCPTCPTGYVADGKGGCKLGCTFDTASVCVSGTTNCKTCTQSGGCYTCTDCKDGYYPENGTCVSCKQKFGDNCEKCTQNKCTTCDDGYEPDPYTGKCKSKACPDGYSTSVTSCDSGYTLKTNGYSGGKACGYCEPNACPSGYTAGLTCGDGFTTDKNGKSGTQDCVKCSARPCSSVSFLGKYKDFSTTKPACTSKSEWYAKALGKSGDATCYACACDGATFGGLVGCCSGGKITCGDAKGPCVECCNDSNCSDGKKCVNGSCVAKCPDGYSTSVTSCTGKEKLETNGSINGKACGKCVSSSTCEALGYHTYGPKMVCTPPIEVTVNGLRCYKCSGSGGGTEGSSCSKCSPSPSGRYYAGSRVCFLGSTEAKNAWQHNHCCDHVSCITVTTGHYCEVGSDGILVGGRCPLNN